MDREVALLCADAMMMMMMMMIVIIIIVLSVLSQIALCYNLIVDIYKVDVLLTS
jgi:hypothetical protein